MATEALPVERRRQGDSRRRIRSLYRTASDSVDNKSAQTDERTQKSLRRFAERLEASVGQLQRLIQPLLKDENPDEFDESSCNDIRFLWYDSDAGSYRGVPVRALGSVRLRDLRVHSFSVRDEHFLLLQRDRRRGLAFLDASADIAVNGVSEAKVAKLQSLGSHLKSADLNGDFAIERHGLKFCLVPVETWRGEWRVCRWGLTRLQALALKISATA